MARKLPWSGGSEPPSKRARTTDNRTSPQIRGSRPNDRGRTETRQRHITTAASLSTLTKRRATSRTPSTSPPPGPPDVEPMIEGYDNDDVWMMVEDEFQTLAQSFTAHLHHAEYKRLIKKAREAPPKELPEPTSPMSKETKRKLEQAALGKRQQEALGRITSGGKIADASDDAEEEKVDDPWRGTALAGLMAFGSQDKTSLKGLEKMPSSTRAAQGYSKAKIVVRPQRNAVDELTKPPEQRTEELKSMKSRRPKQNFSEDEQEESSVGVSNPRRSSMLSTADPLRKTASNGPSTTGTRDSARSHPKPSYPLKRKKTKEESKEDRLAEVPMFLC